MPPFPPPLSYQSVIQNPQICFEKQELKHSKVETDPNNGLPRPRSGGFAITYKLINNKKNLAVRCFYRDVGDREIRYQSICGFLGSNPSEIFVPIHYLKKGILVDGKWYPITYMDWVNGDTLVTFLNKNYTNRKLISAISQEFILLVHELDRLGVAHGDISSANVMVCQNKLKLVDYDGMYVPLLKGKKSNELGNLNFQHPGRTASNFNSQLDRFSAIVIWLALEAIAYNPQFWKEYGVGEGLL